VATSGENHVTERHYVYERATRRKLTLQRASLGGHPLEDTSVTGALLVKYVLGGHLSGHICYFGIVG
jgi:hypothetical protein